VSGRAAFDKRLRVWADKLLYQLDADMHRREQARKSGERTIRIGVGVYRFEEGPSALSNDGAGRPKRRKKGEN
jgi:hypothetical protein